MVDRIKEMTESDKEFKERLAWMYEQISLYWECVDAVAKYERCSILIKQAAEGYFGKHGHGISEKPL